MILTSISPLNCSILFFFLLYRRTIVASAVVMSALVYGRILSGYSILFSLPKIFSFPPEPWRLVTSFLLTGSGMQILFDSYFCEWIRSRLIGPIARCHTHFSPSATVYTYASQLETKVTRFTQPGNFVFYLMFVCSFIAVCLVNSPRRGALFSPSSILRFSLPFRLLPGPRILPVHTICVKRFLISREINPVGRPAPELHSQIGAGLLRRDGGPHGIVSGRYSTYFWTAMRSYMLIK